MVLRIENGRDKKSTIFQYTMKLLSVKPLVGVLFAFCFLCSVNVASAQFRLFPFGRSANNRQETYNTPTQQSYPPRSGTVQNPQTSSYPQQQAVGQRYQYPQTPSYPQQQSQSHQSQPQQPQQARRVFARPALKETPAFPTAYNGRTPKLQEPSISPAARREAVNSIPWNELSPQTRQRVQAILADKTLYRRLAQQMALCEPIMYDFLVDHPDVVVAMWEKLGVTQISLAETGRRTYVLKESVGSEGSVEVLYKTKDYCIIYSRGAYHGPVLPKAIDGETILLLRSYYGKDENGDSYVVANIDAFVKIHNFGIDVFAKMFAPMLGKIADNNFEQTIAFIGNVSEAAQTNPEVLKRLALKLEPIRPEIREEFIRTTYKTAQLAIDQADEENNVNPYMRNLAQQQAQQFESQKQQFEQDRAQYMRELHQRQQVLQANQRAKQRSGQNGNPSDERIASEQRASAVSRRNTSGAQEKGKQESSRVHVGSIPYSARATNANDFDFEFDNLQPPQPRSSTPESRYAAQNAAQSLSPNQDLTGIFSELASDDAPMERSTAKTSPNSVSQSAPGSASNLELDLDLDLDFNFNKNEGQTQNESLQNESSQQSEELPLEFNFDLSSSTQQNSTSDQDSVFSEEANSTSTPIGKVALADKNTQNTQSKQNTQNTEKKTNSSPLTVPTHAPAEQEKLPIYAPVPMKDEIPAKSQPSQEPKDDSQNPPTGTIVRVASQKQVSESSTTTKNSQPIKKSGAVFKTPTIDIP